MNTITSSTGTTVQPHTARRSKGFRFWTGRVLLALVITLVALAAAGASYQTVATAIDQRTYPAPGQLVDVGGYRLHISCVGAGSPTVILLHGNCGTSQDWYGVQPAIATTTRVCAYDRAGMGWSDAGPGSRDAQQIVHELHTLLTNAGIAGPYVLVGHSFGGLYTRVYADEYPDEVTGMVLVDASHPNMWARAPGGQDIYNAGVQMGGILAALAPFGIARLQANMTQLPPNYDMPPGRYAEYQALRSSTRAWNAALAELRATPATMDQVRATRSLGAMPLVVLTAGGDHTQGSQQAAEVEQLHVALQNELAALSTNRTHWIVEGSDHQSLQFNSTHASITSAAILEVVEAARTGQPLTQSAR
jgi:pimeloyl-ACP methyl ester carboxylesterase